MRPVRTDSIVDVRPKLRPAPSVAGAGASTQSTAGGFAALRVDLHSIEDRLAALRDRLETLVHTDELARLEAAQLEAPQLEAERFEARQSDAAQVRIAQAQPARLQPAHVHSPQHHVRLAPAPAIGSAPATPSTRVTAPAPAAPSAPARSRYHQRPAPQLVFAAAAPAAATNGNSAPARGGSPALSAMRLLRGNHRHRVTLERPLPWSNRAHVNGAPVNGAPVNGAAVNGAPAGAFPNGVPVITNSAPSAIPAPPVANGSPGAPAVTNGTPDLSAPAQPVSKLPTLSEVRPAGRTEPTWIGNALRRLAPADREAAGRAIVGLLPIQGDVIPDDVAYDLVISDGAYAVTVTEEEVAIQRIPIPRPLASIDGRIEMTLESLGALPTTKRVRALLRSGSVRVSGRHGKRALAALHQIATAPVGLKRACEAGVVLPEDVLMSLVTAAIPPEWTIGHRFTICVETGSGTTEPHARLFLRVNDGGNVAVNQGLPLDIPTSTIRCSPEQLAHILLGAAPEDATLAGDKAPIMLLQGWVSRLESGRV